MTHTYKQRLLSLFTCIVLGLSGSLIHAKYISGLLSKGATGLTAGTDNLMTIDGIIDGTSLATLSGNAPAVTTIGTSRDMTLNGFAKLEVGQIDAATGALVEAFNESAPAEADGGYVELDETTIVGSGALYAAGDLFIPGAIVKVGSNYNILGSVREAGETGSTASSLFLTQVVAATGVLNTSFNTGGSINLDRTDIAAAYDGGANNNALYTINAAVTDGTRIYVVGSILDDSSSTGTPNKAEAFIGAITASTGAWVTQTGSVDIIILSTANDIELLDLAYDTTNDILYVCGYDGDDAIVRAYKDNGSGVLTIAVTAAADTSSNIGFGTSGQYTYSPASGSSKAWAIKQLSSEGNLIVGLSNSIISNDPLEQSVTVLAVQPAAVNTTGAGSLDTAFSTDGIQTYTFSGIPSAYPHDFSLNYPSFSFENPYLSLQIGDSNAIFLCGSLSAYGMPFVYKLSSAGVEQPFAPNFRYGIDTGNLTSAVLDASPVLYPVMGYSWDTSLQGLFASAIDNTNDQLYLFGCSANVQRSTSDDAFTLNSASDTVQQIPTGNLDLLTENNYPILRTASNTADLTVSNLYNASGVTLSANANHLALAAGIGGLFDTSSLYITIPSQTITSFTLDVGTITEIYGSVGINGVTIPLSGTGSIRVTDADTNDFTTNETTGVTGTLRGAYAGGLVQITFTSATITDTFSGNVTGEYANPIITNYYSSGGVTVFANQTGLTVTNQSEAVFSNNLSIVIPKQTVAAGSFTGNDATVEVFGSVTVSGQEVALSGNGTITVTNAAELDFFLADFASTLTGRYSGGTVTITVSSNGTNLTNVSSPTTDITTSNVNITVNNTYDPVTGDYVISVSDANISVTGESAYTVTVLNFDVVETANTGDQNLFGTVIVDFGGGAQTIAVAGRLDVTVADDQVTEIIVGGGTVTSPTGSYVVGRFNNDKTIFIKINAHSGGSTIVNTRAAQDITGEATLTIDNTVSAGVSATIAINSSTGLASTTNSGGVTVDDLDLVNSISQVFTQKGQHKILISALLDITLPNSSEAISNIVITGYAPITVLQDYSITAQPFKMTGTYSSAGNGDITVTYWVKTISIV